MPLFADDMIYMYKTLKTLPKTVEINQQIQ